MSERENVETIQQLYAAFGRGDIPAMFEAVADEVEWVVPGPSDVPWYGTRRGKEAVMGGYFGPIVHHLDFQAFELKELLAQGEKAAVVLHIEYTVKHTGQKVAADVVHLWTFRGGQIVRLEDFQDTAAVAAAWRGTLAAL